MQVIFKNNWFAPSGAVKKDELRTMSGKRYRKSPDAQDVPDELAEFLPKSAVVVKGPAVPKMPARAESRAEMDMDRAAAEDMPNDEGMKRGPGRPRKE